MGRDSTSADFAADWITTHEMVHLAVPSEEEQHHWIEEGQAVYLEPIARARIGELTAEEVWGDMMRDMPQGQPADGWNAGLELKCNTQGCIHPELNDREEAVGLIVRNES